MTIDIDVNRNKRVENTILFDHRDKKWRIVWNGVIAEDSYTTIDDALKVAHHNALIEDGDEMTLILRGAKIVGSAGK